MKFIHLRNENEERHLHPKGGITIGYDVTKNDVIEYAVAKCGPRDHYCRKIGAKICEGRFKVGQIKRIPFQAERMVDYIVSHVQQDLADANAKRLAELRI